MPWMSFRFGRMRDQTLGCPPRFAVRLDLEPTCEPAPASNGNSTGTPGAETA
jgi:hypothetical protein